jgi:acetylornithine/N-succinyldiaminopimelate aminotransferase
MEGSTLVNRCLKRGVLINSPGERTIRLMPPLIVSEKEAEQFLSVLMQCLAD